MTDSKPIPAFSPLPQQTRSHGLSARLSKELRLNGDEYYVPLSIRNGEREARGWMGIRSFGYLFYKSV